MFLRVGLPNIMATGFGELHCGRLSGGEGVMGIDLRYSFFYKILQRIVMANGYVFDSNLARFPRQLIFTS